MYNCGPTVYDHMTIGNLRAAVFADQLRRTLEYLGYDVTQVMNITDVGHLTMSDVQKESLKKSGKKIEITDTEDGLDRMEKAALREGVSAWEIAEKYTEAIMGKDYEKKKSFGSDGVFGKINMRKPHFLPKASETVSEQIKFIETLMNKGYAYKTKKAVYFDVQKFARYEDLVGQKFNEMREGERAETSDPGRKHSADFRLWQLDQPDHAMQWDSPWGKGFPGWHIECSAMSKMRLGETFDIHTGGEDHIKAHHPNEIAQSESAHGKTMANYWLHNAFLTVDGGRMGKSLGNAYSMNDIERKGYSPMDLRYFYYLAHYRSKQDFTWEALDAARNARRNLIKDLKRLRSYIKSDESHCISQEWNEEFVAALEDDINMPKALAVLWDLLKSEQSPVVKYSTAISFDRVFGFQLKDVEERKRIFSEADKKEIERLVRLREEARKARDWKKADTIRDELQRKYHVIVEDTVHGADWRAED